MNADTASHRRPERGGRRRVPRRDPESIDWSGEHAPWLADGEIVVERLARRYAGAGLALDDLKAAGRLGLVEAVLRFDPERGAMFSTYASWWVRKQMVDAIFAQSHAVTTSRYRIEQQRRLTEARRELRSDGVDRPELSELARRSRLSLEVAGRAQNERVRMTSLDAPDAATGRPALDRLIDENGEDPLEVVIRSQACDRVRELLSTLPRRDRAILRLRYGLDGTAPLSSQKIGERVGLSRERIRQIEARWLTWLRRKIDLRPARGR